MSVLFLAAISKRLKKWKNLPKKINYANKKLAEARLARKEGGSSQLGQVPGVKKQLQVKFEPLYFAAQAIQENLEDHK